MRILPTLPTIPCSADQSPPRTTRRGVVPTRAFLPFTLFSAHSAATAGALCTQYSPCPSTSASALGFCCCSAALLLFFSPSFPFSPSLLSATILHRQSSTVPSLESTFLLLDSLLSFSFPSPLLLCSNQSHSLNPPPFCRSRITPFNPSGRIHLHSFGYREDPTLLDTAPLDLRPALRT